MLHCLALPCIRGRTLAWAPLRAASASGLWDVHACVRCSAWHLAAVCARRAGCTHGEGCSSQQTAVPQVDSEAASGELHMLVQAPLPDPREKVHCNNLALWPGYHLHHNITFKAQLETAHCIFKDYDIMCRKMTRAFRALGVGRPKKAGAAERVSWFMAGIRVPARERGVALARALQSFAWDLACREMLGDSRKCKLTVTRLQRAASDEHAGLVAGCCAC